MVQQTIDAYGSIDILVLNAGISMWAEFEKIEDISFFNTLMAVNYTGSVNCLHAALPELKKSGGKIAAITTAQALIGFPHHSGYAASKHALHGFLDTLDMELEGKIHFLNAYLGWIKGTNLRQSAYGADGSTIGEERHEHNHHAIDLEECTSGIVRAIKSNKKTVLIPYLNVFAKNWLRRKILKNVRDHDS